MRYAALLLRTTWWFCVGVASGAWFIYLVDRYETPSRALAAAFAIGYTSLIVTLDWYRTCTVRPESLESIVRELFEGGHCRQCWASFRLSLLAGSRYGWGPRSIKFWKRWWEREGATLIWVERLSRFVEADLCEDLDDD